MTYAEVIGRVKAHLYLNSMDESERDYLRDELDTIRTMLDVLLSQLKATNVHMSGRHHYRLHHGGWPMTHAIGSTPEEAMRYVVAEVRRSQLEMSQFEWERK